MCAMQVVDLAGIHWSHLPPLNIWCVPAQLWSRSSMNVQREVVAASGRNGGTTVAAVGLVPHRLATGQRHRVRIAEPAHAAHRAEVVVERAVLLHQHDDVLDVLDACGSRGAPGWRARERCCRTASSPRRYRPRAEGTYADSRARIRTTRSRPKDPEPPGSRAREILGRLDRGVHVGHKALTNPGRHGAAAAHELAAAGGSRASQQSRSFARRLSPLSAYGRQTRQASDR